MRGVLLAAALMSVLAACMGGAPRRGAAKLDDYLPYAGAPVDQFRVYQLDSWQALTADQVVIWSDPFTAYLVKVMGPCPELGYTEHIGVTSTVGNVSRFESIVLAHHVRCPIEQIRPIDLKTMKAERAARRATEQPTGQR